MAQSKETSTRKSASSNAHGVTVQGRTRKGYIVTMENTTTETTTSETTTARPVPSQTLTRRVYVDHKVYGTCITIGACVFVPPTGSYKHFTKKDAPRLDFRVTGAGENAEVVEIGLVSVWLYAGQNGGCGPRCPAQLKDTFGKDWHSMSFADRAELIKVLKDHPIPAK